MTSKEKMSEYLLRLQQWQRMSLGIVDFTIIVRNDVKGVHFYIAVCEKTKCNPFALDESYSQESNKATMKKLSDYLHKLKVI